MRLPRPRLAARLLLFNLLLVFLPIAGLLSLGTLERRLLERQEESLASQARLLATALGESGELIEEEVRLLLRGTATGDSLATRFQVLDRHGHLLADTATLSGAAPLGLAPPLAGPAIQAALAGVAGGGRVPSEGAAATLYRLSPVRSGTEVVGAVSASAGADTTRAEVAELRRSILPLFVASLIGAALLTLYYARTLARPLERLTQEAAELLDPRGQVRTSFSASDRHDEIGDVARALEELARRLRAHLAAAESTAADLSHEIKNPLASIRGAAELLAEVDDRADRRRFLDTIEREIARLETLLRAVRQSAALESQLLTEERQPVALGPLVAQLAEAATTRSNHAVEFSGSESLSVMAVRERLHQVLDNMIDNAVSFSPEGVPVSVTLERRNDSAVVSVRDRGPGVPPEHAERIFERFFSYRPAHAGGAPHTGLGLAIARTIARAYGGELRARNHPEGGAVFELHLPLARVGDFVLRTG